MAAGPEIRTALPADRTGILRLWRALIDHHRRIDPRPDVPSGIDALLHAEVERALGSPACRLLVAVEDDAPVGFLFAEIEPDRADATGLRPRPPLAGSSAAPRGSIHELYVEPARRRAGLGGGLVEAVEGWFHAEGVRRVRVRVEAGNTGGLRFWAARGFREHDRRLERRLAGPRD